MTAHLLLRAIHIAMGTLALAAGASSMLLPKGSRAHARAGTVFFGAMMVMAGTGTLLAAFLNPNAGNVMGGLLASYLTLTAWATVWRAPRATGRLEVAAALLGAATALLGFRWGIEAAAADRRMLDGYPYQLYVAFGAVALIGAVLDARMIVRGGYAGAQRTTRHLTRMCLAMYMATASFFLGQAKLFPEAVRRSGMLTIPVLLVVAALLYWLVRLRLWPMLRRARSRVLPSNSDRGDTPHANRHTSTPPHPPMSFVSRLLSPDHARYDGVRPIQIHLLRTFYFLVAAFVGTDAWRTVLTHEGPWDHVRAVAWCMWAAYSTMSMLGLIHPLRMLPLMIFVIVYKTLWLAVVAYPLWRAGTLAGPTEEMATVFMWMWILALAIPWGYAWRRYVRWGGDGQDGSGPSTIRA